jgi:hypothetical protein
MNAPAKLGAFAVALAAVLGGATAVGAATGPIGYADNPPTVGQSDAHADGGPDAHSESGGPDAQGSTDGGAPILPKGLAVSQNGYTLHLAQDQLTAGRPATLELSIQGPDGHAVTAYTPTHDKDLHLIVVRRDLSSFQHLHPVRDDAGTWTVPVTLASGGEYRVFADFAPAGTTTAMTLGTDLSVAGDYQPQELPTPQRTTTVEDYTVTLDGKLVPGQESRLTLNVSKAGRPVTDLQPYLGAYGHLVVLRDGDLAYLHVHPAGEPGDGRTPAGPGVTFYATAPTAGDYRLFLDFRHQDGVRTAAFTARAGAASPVSPSTARTADATPAAPGHAEATAGEHSDDH